MTIELTPLVVMPAKHGRPSWSISGGDIVAQTPSHVPGPGVGRSTR